MGHMIFRKVQYPDCVYTNGYNIEEVEEQYKKELLDNLLESNHVKDYLISETEIIGKQFKKVVKYKYRFVKDYWGFDRVGSAIESAKASDGFVINSKTYKDKFLARLEICTKMPHDLILEVSRVNIKEK